MGTIIICWVQALFTVHARSKPSLASASVMHLFKPYVPTMHANTHVHALGLEFKLRENKKYRKGEMTERRGHRVRPSVR